MNRRVRLSAIPLLLLAVAAVGCSPKRVVTRPGAPDFGGSVVRPDIPVSETDIPLRAETAAALAHEQIGRPYSYGGASPTGFDCSGLALWAYGRVGVSLPRTVRRQIGVGSAVGRENLRPGDLVFFNTRGDGASHVGIFLTDSVFIHAPATGGAVRTDDLNDAWWQRRYVTARRVVADR